MRVFSTLIDYHEAWAKREKILDDSQEKFNQFKFDESTWESLRAHESFRPNESESLNSQQLSSLFRPGFMQEINPQHPPPLSTPPWDKVRISGAMKGIWDKNIPDRGSRGLRTFSILSVSWVQVMLEICTEPAVLLLLFIWMLRLKLCFGAVMPRQGECFFYFNLWICNEKLDHPLSKSRAIRMH